MHDITPRPLWQHPTWNGENWYVPCARIRCSSPILVEEIEGYNSRREYQYVQDTIVVSKDDYSFAVCSFGCIASAAKRYVS